MSKICEICSQKLQKLHFSKIWFLVFFGGLKNQKKIFGEDSFFQFWVHLDPFFIKISRFHARQQEKIVTKVIISLSWTNLVMSTHLRWYPTVSSTHLCGRQDIQTASWQLAAWTSCLAPSKCQIKPLWCRHRNSLLEGLEILSAGTVRMHSACS